MSDLDDIKAHLERLRGELMSREQFLLSELDKRIAQGNGNGQPSCRFGYRSADHPEGECPDCKITYQRGGAGARSEVVYTEAMLSAPTHEDRVKRAAELIVKGAARHGPDGRWLVQGRPASPGPETIQLPGGRVQDIYTGRGSPGGLQNELLDEAEKRLRDDPSFRSAATLHDEGQAVQHQPGCDGAAGVCGCGAVNQASALHVGANEWTAKPP